jgi:hypothetical protein
VGVGMEGALPGAGVTDIYIPLVDGDGK